MLFYVLFYSYDDRRNARFAGPYQTTQAANEAKDEVTDMNVPIQETILPSFVSSQANAITMGLNEYNLWPVLPGTVTSMHAIASAARAQRWAREGA